MGKFFQKFKSKLISIGAGIGLTFILIMGFFAGVMETESTSSATYSGSYSDYVNLGDYIVKTDEEGAMPALTKEQLITAINGAGFTDKMKQHYIDWADAIIKVQVKYKVNAAFTLAVLQNEHGGGGPGGDINWGVISPSTYNIFSIRKNDGGWVSYDSYEDAIDAFGNLIANTGPYFAQGNYTVEAIRDNYNNDLEANWAGAIKDTLNSEFSAVAETIPNTGSVSGQKIVKKAEEIMQYMMDNGYSYVNGNRVPLSANGKYCDCSAFVCWVLYDLGITDCQNNGYQLTTYTMDTNGKGYFPDHGWTKITSYDDLQPGDIVIMSGEGNGNGHVQIFAYRKDGVNYYINCGWDPYRHTSVYDTHQTTFYSAWRMPK